MALASASPALKQPVALSIATIREDYRLGRSTPRLLLEDVLARIVDCGRHEIWTCRTPIADLLQQADALSERLAVEGPALLERYPLFGIPFAIKDNIDVAGLPTTAACPQFAYLPEASAEAVRLLLQGHALLLGKTNLDQFATGLVGTRSPFGAVRNAVDPEFISGGSSSGSAVSVALGLAAFALGTDTAGSGRVPAALNGIVGIKPTHGLVSTRGVVPACRSLDCISVFAGSVADAWEVVRAIAVFDAQEPYSREMPIDPLPHRGLVLGVPKTCEFFGDAQAQAAFEAAIAAIDTASGSLALRLETFDDAPLLQAAEQLYEGPWVAERRAAIGTFFDAHAEAIDPAVRAVVAVADRFSAVDAFRGEYQMAGYRRSARILFNHFDALIVPTAPIHPRIAEVQAEPIELNRRMGYYTNFLNLLDLAAIAIPVGPRANGLPFGITLVGPAGSDLRLAQLAARLCASLQGTGTPPLAPLQSREPMLELAVVGAHLQGQPLNWQLLECGAHLTAQTHTSPFYRLFALSGTQPPKPGLMRMQSGGAAIEVESWSIPQRRFGDFISRVAQPLAIGSVQLEDGRWVKGFVCEPLAMHDATDITHYGGWRAYLESHQ